MKIHMCVLYWLKLSGCIITENEKAYFVMKTISSSFVTIKDFKYQMMHYFCHICSMGSKGLTQQFTHKATLPRLLDKVVNLGFAAQFCDKLNPMYDTNWSTTILLLKSRKCHLIMLDICESWRKKHFCNSQNWRARKNHNNKISIRILLNVVFCCSNSLEMRNYCTFEKFLFAYNAQ